MKYIPLLVGALLMVGCAQQNPTTPATPLQPAGLVIKARETLTVNADTSDALGQAFLASSIQENSFHEESLSSPLPITVGNGISTSMKMDTSQFVIPVVCNKIVDFGFIGLSSLDDNNLNVCGPKGNEHCGTALIRMYTTGTAGAGLWNDVDQFGAPISVGEPSQVVGLGSAGAVVLQKISIPKSKHVVRLSDFAPVPRYSVKSDFSDAGAGNYTTTLVIEYALAP